MTGDEIAEILVQRFVNMDFIVHRYNSHWR